MLKIIGKSYFPKKCSFISTPPFRIEFVGRANISIMALANLVRKIISKLIIRNIIFVEMINLIP